MTNPAVIDPDALRHLGAVIQKIRPAWDAPGIRSALETALTAGTYPDVALVAVSSARDPSAATPAVIWHRIRNGWTTTVHDETKPPTQQPDSTADMRCRCGMWVVRGENHTCAQLGDPHAGAAAARAALHAARKGTP
jgi:hypothetical protein